jgi:hypothetical protein
MRIHAPNSSFGWFWVSFYPFRPPASLARQTPIPTSAAPLEKPFAGLYLIRLNICGK